MHVQEWIKLANRVFKFDGFWGCLCYMLFTGVASLCQLRQFTGGKQQNMARRWVLAEPPKLPDPLQRWGPQDS